MTNSDAITRLDKEIIQIHSKQEREVIKHSEEVEIAKQRWKENVDILIEVIVMQK